MDFSLYSLIYLSDPFLIDGLLQHFDAWVVRAYEVILFAPVICACCHQVAIESLDQVIDVLCFVDWTMRDTVFFSENLPNISSVSRYW